MFMGYPNAPKDTDSPYLCSGVWIGKFNNIFKLFNDAMDYINQFAHNWEGWEMRDDQRVFNTMFIHGSSLILIDYYSKIARGTLWDLDMVGGEFKNYEIHGHGTDMGSLGIWYHKQLKIYPLMMHFMELPPPKEKILLHKFAHFISPKAIRGQEIIYTDNGTMKYEDVCPQFTNYYTK
eukprot:78771_1